MGATHPDRHRYVIGDVQGCFDELQILIQKIGFDPGQDRLWVAGDLINRGPGNLAVLRYLKSLGERVVCVLGNHDIFFLAVVSGAVSQTPEDTLQDLLEAPDRDELVDWLRRRPLFHVEDGYAMVHAGLLPQWSVAQAEDLAAEVECELGGEHWQEFLRGLWGGKPCAWRDDLTGPDRLRLIVNAMSRLRFLRSDASIDLKPKGCPEDQPGLIPWYAYPDARWQTHTILHGHWSALGYRNTGGVVSLDTGCVWGGRLSALRLKDRHLFQVEGLSGLVSAKGD